MKRLTIVATGLLSLTTFPVFARGVSPYLPLNLDPQTERMIERALTLADKPVLTRPIAAATVLDALPRVCQTDPALCRDVRRYLSRYMRDWGVTHASLEGSTSSSARETLPNRYGQTTGSTWDVSIA